MTTEAPRRIRMFGGPNGSGKSTVLDELRKSWLGIYVNADDIEREWKRDGFLDLSQFELNDDAAHSVLPFFESSPLVGPERLAAAQVLTVGPRVSIQGLEVNSYLAAAAADFIRHELLAAGKSFTFESVMSHRGKVDFLKRAQQEGYRSYLYFIATDDPEINVARVEQRVQLGGHPVARDRIIDRYHKSIALLEDAVSATHRAYIFDNSGDRHVLLAEITAGDQLQTKADVFPRWFTESSLWLSFKDELASEGEDGAAAAASEAT